jgi:hypothetical protein
MVFASPSRWLTGLLNVILLKGSNQLDACNANYILFTIKNQLKKINWEPIESKDRNIKSFKRKLSKKYNFFATYGKL